MKIYLRILQYTPRAAAQYLKFFFFSVVGALFSAAYLRMLQPLIDLLFRQKINIVVPPEPKFALSLNYFQEWLQYQFYYSLENKGPAYTLLMVCSLIVLFVLLANTMRYIERLIASRVKVDVVKN